MFCEMKEVNRSEVIGDDAQRRSFSSLGRLLPLDQRLSRDAGAVCLLLILTLLPVLDELRRSAEFAHGDFVNFFLPMYSFLGDRLRAGDIPGWNPHQFAGAPFAGDPESGWMYLPAMLLFTAFSPAAAYTAFVAFHLALAGLGAYALARMLGLGVAGSSVAGVAYEHPWVLDKTTCCPPFVQVVGWLPVALLGAEIAIRGRVKWRRLGGWALAGFAVSQILASWLGQGAYYGLLVLGSFVAYRTLLVPPRQSRRLPARAGDAVLHGAAIFACGAALGAAGVLPRLEANAHSNVAGGVYRAAYAAEGIGWSWREGVEELLSGYLLANYWYAGGATLALAVVAPVVARRWLATPYFVGVGLGLLLLTSAADTPLHALLYAVLPRFEAIHGHAPERAVIFFYLGAALLAGATVDHLERWRCRRVELAVVGLMPAAVLALLLSLWGGPDPVVSWPTHVAIAAVCVLLVAYAVLAFPSARRLVPVGLLLVVVWDPSGRLLANRLSGHLEPWEARIDLDAYGEPSGAAAALARMAEAEPARYFGFDPRQLRSVGSVWLGYIWSPGTPLPILVNNRATLLGLDDVQGYNPVQVQRYVEYVAAMNGFVQEYHEADVFPPGLGSPLLDALNARYVVVPPDRSRNPHPSVELPAALDGLPVVYEDREVRVLERPTALPRAWIVHDARRVARGEALPLLASGEIDPRRTVLLEEDPPPLRPPPAPAPEPGAVTVTAREPDAMRLRVSSGAPGLLVVSESYDPAWRAYVDGRPAPLYVANHALRAVPVPEGDHRVELRYQSSMLRLGTAVSLGAYALLAVLGGTAAWRRWSGHARNKRSGGRPGPAVR